MKYKTFVTLGMCATILFGCGTSTEIKPTVEPTTYTPVEHVDTPIMIFDNSVLSYSTAYNVLYDLDNITVLLSNKDGTYTVFGDKPENCDDVNAYIPDSVVNLSDEEATSFSYFTKTVGHENISKTKFSCTLLRDSDNTITGVKLDYYVKGDDVSG